MTDPYAVLGVDPSASEEEIKKAYRAKCKQFHPDLHPGDAQSEEKFKEVQAAYSEIMKIHDGPAGAPGAYGQARRPGYGTGGPFYQSYGPFGFGFGFDPFGFDSAPGPEPGQEVPRMQAARNYINAQRYREALTALGSIPQAERVPRWYYYAALASLGLGNRIHAMEYAETAAQMDPGNYEYQNLVDRLNAAARSYTQRSASYQVQPMGLTGWCVSMVLLNLFARWCCWGSMC